MRICITLDDVLRAKTYQFGKMYKNAGDDFCMKKNVINVIIIQI